MQKKKFDFDDVLFSLFFGVIAIVLVFICMFIVWLGFKMFGAFGLIIPIVGVGVGISAYIWSRR